MPYADISGQRIFYTDSGGDGPVAVFSHGFLMDHSMFSPQVAALSPEFRVVAWDARGFGATGFDGKPFTYWDSARDALALCDHLGVQRAVFAGMSQGGPGDELANIVAGIILDEPSLNAAWIARWQSRPHDLLREPGRCLLERESLLDRLGEIACPALVIHGSKDSAIAPELAEAMSAALPGSDGVLVIEGAAHAANLTHPEPVNAALLSFLRGLS